MRTTKKTDVSYLDGLIKRWGMDKLEQIAGYPRTAIYQWRPSRVAIPAEAALRIQELTEEKDDFYVEKVCPTLNWGLLYGGRDRRVAYEGALLNGLTIEAAVKRIGVTEVARVVGRSRQNIYNGMAADKCPVWLALAIEEASGQLYLVEDFRPELPWYPLYTRRALAHPIPSAEVEAFREDAKASK